MHALVTGANGFLGRYIVEQLIARGDRVRALCRRADPALREIGAEIALGDIRDHRAVIDACKAIDCVFHVAGVAGIWGPWRHFFDTNVSGTIAVVAGCKSHNVGRLIYTSSPSVTFDGGDQCGVDESAPYPRRWLCHYQHTKALAEDFVLFSNRPREGSPRLLTCALRPHLIWGPRDRHLVPRLLERARRGQLRRVGDGTNLIDMVYVENAAAAHVQAADALTAESPVAGRAYFISEGKPVNCWQWINELLVLADLPPITRSISAKAAWRIGAVLETVHRALFIRREPRMTRFLAAQLSRSHYFNITAAQRDFGYRPIVATEEGMRRLQAGFHGT